MFARVQVEISWPWLFGLFLISCSIASWAKEADRDCGGISEIETESTSLDPNPENMPLLGERLKHPTSYPDRPLQITGTRVDREAGLANAARALQEATQVHKVRIVLSFAGSISPVTPRRTTFTSVAPLQVISAKLERQFGRLEPMDLFQEET